jgi:hypothetical protein
MIYSVRSAGIAAGKANEAIAWAVKVANWINEKYPGANVQVLRNVSGQLTQVHWLATTGSLGEYEQLMIQIDGDEEYQTMMRDAMSNTLYAEGSLHHTFYRTVEG